MIKSAPIYSIETLPNFLGVLYILYLCIFIHIFCTRPAGVSVSLFVYQIVQGANISRSKGALDAWKPTVSTQVQDVAHFVLSLPKFCHQLLLLSKSNLILTSNKMGGNTLKVPTWSYQINLNFAIFFRYWLNWSHVHFYWCFIVTFSMSYLQIMGNTLEHKTYNILAAERWR